MRDLAGKSLELVSIESVREWLRKQAHPAKKMEQNKLEKWDEIRMWSHPAALEDEL